MLNGVNKPHATLQSYRFHLPALLSLSGVLTFMAAESISIFSLIKKLRLAIAALLLAIALGVSVSGQRALHISQDYYYYLLTDYKASLHRLEKTYDLTIDYEVGPEFIDEKGRAAPINGKAVPLDELGIARFSKILPKVLALYPPDVIKNNLKAIKLSKEVWFYGVRYGASAIDHTVYLTDSGREEGFTDFYISQTFHHELSSVLMRNHAFPTQTWLDANPPDVKYQTDFENYLKSIAQDRDLKGNDYFYQRGVMSKYSYSTLENDFNLYAQTVFNEPVRMKMLINQYPRIKTKYEILKAFYLSISPKFSTVFERIG